MYSIYSFKTSKGGGVVFIDDEKTTEKELKSYLFDGFGMGNCQADTYSKETFWDKCENCFACVLQNDVEEYHYIGEVEVINSKHLYNFQDKFFFEGGDCC